jgi:hypothetical protein
MIRYTVSTKGQELVLVKKLITEQRYPCNYN